jgi:Invasin, domain 3
MKTSSLILLALFTLCSCKFSFDKAKVEESYGNYDGGAGGGGSTCPTNDPDPSYSTLSVDSTKLADGIEEATLTYTLLDCNSQPIIGFTPLFTATDSSSLNTQTACTASDSSGLSTCTLKSEYAETKTITTTNIALATTTIDFTKPPLTISLTACLAGDSSGTGLPMNSGLYLPSVSPYVGHPTFFTNGESGQYYSIPNTAVDWVLVQIYDESTGNSIDAKSAIIHTDGTIKSPDGSSLSFTSNNLLPTYNSNYNLNIIHRNHLSIGLNLPINHSTGSIDLTDLSTAFLGETGTASSDPYKIVAGKKCLRSGDFNQDFIVDNSDINDMRAFILLLTGVDPASTSIILTGYYPTDVSLNGQSHLYLVPGPIETQDTDVIRDQIDNFTMTVPFPIWNSGAP